MTPELFINTIGGINVHWIWIPFLVGVVIGFLIAILFARSRAGRGLLDAVFRGLSVLFRFPPRISQAINVWRENRQRRRLRAAAAAEEIEGLQGEIEALKEQIGERRRQITEARWRAGKP